MRRLRFRVDGGRGHGDSKNRPQDLSASCIDVFHGVPPATTQSRCVETSMDSGALHSQLRPPKHPITPLKA